MNTQLLWAMTLVIISAFGVSACADTASTNTAKASKAPTTQSNTDQNSPSQDSPSLSTEQALFDQASAIRLILANKDYDKLISHIHPTAGVRFSMYAYVQPKKDKVFSQAEFKKYLTQPAIKFTWGEYDGSGEPAIMSLPEYLNDWVVKKDGFEQATPIVNAFKGTGNSINNLLSIYPHHQFVEFYHTGSQKYDHMDWWCLRLVFAPHEGKLYLVGVITDQWTI